MRGVLLTDHDEPVVHEAAILLGDWRVVVCTDRDLGNCVAAQAEAGAVLTATTNANALRHAVAQARARGIPVVVGCRDDTAWRRALEVGAEEWFLVGASAREIASRVRTALSRVAPAARFSADEAERARFEHMLFDPVSAQPTLPIAIERLRSLVHERGRLVVTYFDFVRYARVEEIFGWERLDAVRETTARTVEDALAEFGDGESRMAASWVHDEDFVVLHVPVAPGRRELAVGDPDAFASTVRARILEAIERSLGAEIAAALEICSGEATAEYTPKVRLERLVYHAMREAADAARSQEYRERTRRLDELQDALRAGAVYIEYHPIVAAGSRRVIGYEALARGEHHALRSPEVLFGLAAEADRTWELARLCRERAVQGMSRLPAEAMLFLNVDPHDLADPQFDALDAMGVEPARVVLEITERTAITDYPRLRERLRQLRGRGYRLAVDDAGSGYAGLGSIANLEPEFIKLDIALIRGIEGSPVKQHLVETLVRFANEQGTTVVAEGVERAEEYETVRSLGVHLVQGFFLHRPERADAEVPAVVVADQPTSPATSSQDRVAAPSPRSTTPRAAAPAPARADVSSNRRPS
jgi:EAL domain-containing protein (putative c-di-GMP-specific phosphodiesterase class I)